MPRRRKNKLKPVFSGFVFGLLIAIGIDPGQMIFEAAVKTFEPYIQFAALIILAIAVFFSYSSIVDGINRSRRAYRTAGLIGVAGLLCAIFSGFIVLSSPDRAVVVLLLGMVMWLYATWK